MVAIHRRSKDSMLPNNCWRQGRLRIRQLSCLNSYPVQVVDSKKKGRDTMARQALGYLPQGNPCAQCGKPIAAPEWIENGPRRISYLWHCRACDYQFEAVAFYDASRSNPEALAA
jgi:hypothetical protein